MKKALSIIVSVILVALSCVTGVFASTVWPEYALSSSSSVSVNFTDDGFTVSSTSGNQFMYFKNVSSIWGQVSWESSPLIADGSLLFSFPVVDSTTSITYGDLVNSKVLNNQILVDGANTQGSFSFVVTTTNPSFTTGQARFSTTSQHAVTYTFDQLTINGSDVISGIVGETAGFVIPAGYAVVIEGPFDIVEQSFYINNSWDFVHSDTHRVNGAMGRVLGTSAIRDGFSPDRFRPREDFIQWEAVNENLFGNASQYEFFDSTNISVGVGECFVISYPKLYGYGTVQSNLTRENAVDMVCGMSIMYSTRPTFRWVAIESLSDVTSTGSYSTYSVFRPDLVDSEGEATSGGSGGVVITPEDNLPSGGGNAGQPPVDEDSSLLGTISKFVNDIKNLLSSAVEAINTLVSQGGQFMQNIGAMFTWLPTPLLTVIISAFTVLLVVGVLKVLWR